MPSKNIAFMASSEIAIPSLKTLAKSKYRPCVVYTQPPRPKGRGLKVTPTPIHEFASAHDIPVQTPTDWKNLSNVNLFTSLKIDCAIVFAYGLILPEIILKTPKHGFLNLHASLLPKWRGATPIQRAIEAGDSTSGISLMAMTEKLDAGPILTTWKYNIPTLCSSMQLFNALAKISADNIVNALDDFFSEKLIPIPQDEALTSYAHKIKKIETKINWNDHALNIQQKCLAFTPSPNCYFSINNQNIKLLQCIDVSSEQYYHNLSSGTIISAEDAIIACGNNSSLKIISIRRPNKKNENPNQILKQIISHNPKLF